jgi:hypothetical protein
MTRTRRLRKNVLRTCVVAALAALLVAAAPGLAVAGVPDDRKELTCNG